MAKTQLPAPVIGAHVGGGLKGSITRALEIGAQALQIFIGSPQSWKATSARQDDFETFRSEIKRHRLGPVFVHGIYLVNLASPSRENYGKSVHSLQAALRLADQAGAEALIFHPGSAVGTDYRKAFERVLRALEMVLDGYNGSCRLALEVCAGQGQTIGDSFCQFADILSALNYDRRLAICWDTCHLFNAGYDIASPLGLETTVSEFQTVVGLEWLVAIHANDSKTPLGARRDRHENIGCGQIGEAAFARMLQHPALRPLPWILEVPGFDRKGPDRANIETLKQLARLR